jgi:hypothetical protein|tara:strand:- start:243 stop:632 length:390 start_codon:yes stop_codon:yes gene_type:complete
METISLFFTALLFGGMCLYSFGFAAFVFTSLPSELAGQTIRRAFPHFYIFVLLTSTISAVLVFFRDPYAAAVLGVVALVTLPTRQILMPAINQATDEGKKRLFAVLHGLSVAVTLMQIAATAYVLARFV